MAQSALSHAVKTLEERLGVRLLARTTRSVSTTEAGETLLRSLRPVLADITSGVDAVGAPRGNSDNSGSAVGNAARLTHYSLQESRCHTYHRGTAPIC